MQEQTTALAIAKDYPADQFNLLIPVKTMQELSPLHKMIINEVQISPNPNDKDVYKEKNGEYALHKRSLMKLMAAANIQVIDSRPVPTQKCAKCYQMAQATRMAPKCFECPYQDDVAFQVTIAVPELSGTHRIVKATKEIRMEDSKDSMSDAQFKAFKPFRTEQCESKALNRALREGLMIKSSYRAEELKKPFAVALVMPNMNDPDLKKAMIAQYANNVNALFGSQAPAQIEGSVNYQALSAGNMTEIPPDEDDYDRETGEVNPPSLEVIDITIEPETEIEPPVIIGCEGEDCGGIIEPFIDGAKKEWQPEEWAEETRKRTGRKLCVACFIKWQKEQKAIKEAEKAEKAKKDKAGGK